MHALSTRNDDPKQLQTMDKDRDGCIGKEQEHLFSKNTNMQLLVALLYIVKLVVAVCLQISHNSSHPDGLGAKNVMLNCLRDAGLKPTDVDGVNMHGTSTPLGDLAESKAIEHFWHTCLHHELKFN
jgi:3-oxoacyl-[acyl-carrier-protein] synthase II